MIDPQNNTTQIQSSKGCGLVTTIYIFLNGNWSLLPAKTTHDGQWVYKGLRYLLNNHHQKNVVKSDQSHSDPLNDPHDL